MRLVGQHRVDPAARSFGGDSDWISKVNDVGSPTAETMSDVISSGEQFHSSVSTILNIASLNFWVVVMLSMSTRVTIPISRMGVPFLSPVYMPCCVWKCRFRL